MVLKSKKGEAFEKTNTAVCLLVFSEGFDILDEET